jgi:hypothetical protein
LSICWSAWSRLKILSVYYITIKIHWKSNLYNLHKIKNMSLLSYIWWHVIWRKEWITEICDLLKTASEFPSGDQINYMLYCCMSNFYLTGGRKHWWTFYDWSVAVIFVCYYWNARFSFLLKNHCNGHAFSTKLSTNHL